MSDVRSPLALRLGQYRDASKLDARIALHSLFSVNRQGWVAWLFEQVESLGLGPGAEILELGCGPGTLWRENAPRIPEGWRIVLSDFSQGMIADARTRLADVAGGFRFEVFDASTIPHPADRFDAVLANHMLYHVSDRPKAFGEIARVLRPGGVLVASTLTVGSMQEIESLVHRATTRSDFEFNRSVSSFPLDTGEQQLSAFFLNVERRHYEDALEITDPAPLQDYLGSLILQEPLREDELAAIGELTQQEIDREGSFHVSKDSGVFIAR